MGIVLLMNNQAKLQQHAVLPNNVHKVHLVLFNLFLDL